jgi:methylated-DNA-[protein]-cysteine S-methyltransferase
MNTIYITYYQSPVGTIVLGSYNNELCLANWHNAKHKERVERRVAKGLKAKYEEGSSETIEKCIKQLDEFFANKRENFDIPLLLVGSEFQKSVWKALLDVAYGKTASYLELSRNIGNEKAVRAVANANGANAISILVPCHRIIGTNGTLTGYAGGLDIKEKLLKIEVVNKNERV